MRIGRAVRIVFAVTLLCAAVAAGGVALAQHRTAVRLADPTDAGRFEGTWAYTNRDAKIALWLRESADGPPEVKMRYSNSATREEFETDWSGHAEYYVAGQRARFEIKLTGGDADAATGTWDWVVQFSDAGREEHGRFTMQRGHDGRKLVLRFAEFERRRTVGPDVRVSTPEHHGMTFVKASKRIVLWDELPF